MSEEKKNHASESQDAGLQRGILQGDSKTARKGADGQKGDVPNPPGKAAGGMEVNETPAEENRATVWIPSAQDARKERVSMQPTLEVVKGQANRKEFSLGLEKIKIGRVGYNDVVLNDGKVSRSHAEIYFEKGQYVIEDTNSTNGVFVDAQKIKKMVLKPGTHITLGECVLVFNQGVPEVSLDDKLAFINKSDLLNWLDQETKVLLARNLRVWFFPKDSVVLRQDAPVESMYFLYSGAIRVVEINEEGGERVFDQISAGDYFGERALLAGESGKYSMIANTDLHVLELRKEKLNELLLEKPDLNQAFYRMVLKKLSHAQSTPELEDHRQDSLKSIVTPTDVEIVGDDKKIKDAKKKIEEFAGEARSVLIVGAPGTGKKDFARYFHQQSPHPEYPYVEISLAELDKAKVGAVIFGVEGDPDATHMKGQMGYLEMIDKGTLAISHAEQLDAHQQSRLATYLKQGWFHRVYGRDSIKAGTNVVLIATGTEVELKDKFIPELMELLQGRVISLPVLTQRLKDIPILAEHYLKFYAKQNGKEVSGLSREATEKLVSYTWPGNVEELQNVVQRAVIVSSENVIIPGDLIFVVPSEKDVHKLNVLRQDKVRDIFRHPLIPKIFMWFNMLMVIAMAGFTLFGGSRPEGDPLQEFGNNPGMIVTWLIWFPILPISAFLLGRIWCGVCPIAGIGDLAARIMKFNLPVPKILKRLDFWMVMISFMFLDFVEEFFGVAEKPWATGMLLVIIISVAAIFCILFERRTFCRYLCPLAGMLGTYSTMSIVEVRGNKKICQTQCGQHLCYKGSERAMGCPMFSYPASLSSNSECMMCLSCIKSCENRGVQLNLRPPLQELWRQSQPIFSLSLFGVILVGLMARHQFPALTFWKAWEQSLQWPEWKAHTVLFLSFVTLAIVTFFFSSMVSAAASREKLKENMAHYGMAFIPLALSGHVAHIAHELLSEGVYDLIKYFIMLYDSVTAGIPVGSREVLVSPFIHGSVVSFIKFLLLSGGFLGSLIALVMIARRWSEKNAMGRAVPHIGLLLFFWIGYLFIFLGATGMPAETAAAAPQVAAASSGPASSQSAGTTVHPPAAVGQDRGAAAQIPLSTGAQGAAAGPVQPVKSAPAVVPTFSITLPGIQGLPSVPLVDANVAQWLRSAMRVPGTNKYRLALHGQVSGAPRGAQLWVSLDTGTTASHMFASPLEPAGFFSGEIQVFSLREQIALTLHLMDADNRKVIATHKVTLY